MDGKVVKQVYGILIAVMAFAGGLGVAYWLHGQQPHGSHGILQPAPPQGGDFTLQAAGSAPFRLSDLRGKVVLLYFGYTACPDVCPTNLATLAAAIKQLTPQEQPQVQAVLISVDPERDTNERLARYAAHFHPSFIGVTGTAGQIAQAAQQYGVAYRKVDSGSAMGYLVDHSAETYLLDKTGKLIQRLPHGSTPQQVVDAVRPLL